MKAFVHSAICLLLMSCSENTMEEKNRKSIEARVQFTVADKGTAVQWNDSMFIERISSFVIIKQYEENTGGKISYLTKSAPNKENSFYLIKAGFNRPERFETVFNFYCYPGSGDIRLYDALKDTLMEPK